MHQGRVCNEVTQDPAKQFPNPEEGKYYLIDAGYKNQKGFLVPFKGCRYHQLLDGQEMQTKFSTRCTPPYEVQLNIHSEYGKHDGDSYITCLDMILGKCKCHWSGLQWYYKILYAATPTMMKRSTGLRMQRILPSTTCQMLWVLVMTMMVN